MNSSSCCLVKYTEFGANCTHSSCPALTKRCTVVLLIPSFAAASDDLNRVLSVGKAALGDVGLMERHSTVKLSI